MRRQKNFAKTLHAKGLAAQKVLPTRKVLPTQKGLPRKRSGHLRRSGTYHARLVCKGLAGANRSQRYAYARRASSRRCAIRSRRVRCTDRMVVDQCGDFEYRSAGRILLLHDRLARHWQHDPALSRFRLNNGAARCLSLMRGRTCAGRARALTGPREARPDARFRAVPAGSFGSAAPGVSLKRGGYCGGRASAFVLVGGSGGQVALPTVKTDVGLWLKLPCQRTSRTDAKCHKCACLRFGTITIPLKTILDGEP